MLFFACVTLINRVIWLFELRLHHHDKNERIIYEYGPKRP
jgi:hypothetical protein